MFTPKVDQILVHYVNQLCRERCLSSSRIHPQEILLSESDRADPSYACLSQIPVEYLRLRFAFLQSVNVSISKYLLPAVSLGAITTYEHSISALLYRSRSYIFYDVKLGYLHFIVNLTDKRCSENVPPEIIFDPLNFVHQAERDADKTITVLAKEQLSRTPSSEFCVKIATGGDPIFPFNVKLTGEVVQGTSGSFRYFIWLVAQELLSSSLPVLIECPSASAGENKNKFLLAPKTLSYKDEALLQFFGVLLGVAIRSDVPFPIDCLLPFWKRLLGEPLSMDKDLRQTDIITDNFINQLQSLKTENEFDSLVIKTCPTHFTDNEDCSPTCPYNFNYASIDGNEVSLKADSSPIKWQNLSQFVDAILEFRKSELDSNNIIPIIQCGLSSIVPLEPLLLLGPKDLELRICGLQEIDISFLKLHTIYQVGISATDKHIEFFWNVVDSLSQDDLRKLIKFACNQERIPFSCPCQVR